MDQVQHSEVLCNAIMALISRELYNSGLNAIELIKQGREMAKRHPHQQLWPSIFSGSQVIVNRVTPPHRDSGGCPMHYDLLVSAGTPHKPSLVFQNWGFICLIGLEMLWHCVERCFCMRWKTGQEERESVCPTT